MDNAIDASRFALDEQRAEAMAKRRIGLGVTGLADAFLMLGIRYGSKQSVELTERLLGAVRDAAYAASAAADLTDRGVMVLEGGTAAWKAADLPETHGFENMADENNDIQYKAYDHDDNIEFHMQEYLSWETGLVEQVERDGTARFKHFPI